MSRYLYKKIQNISPESLNFQHSGLKLTTLSTDTEEADAEETDSKDEAKEDAAEENAETTEAAEDAE